MKIYKGDVGCELTVQAFLDLLEEEALDELIETVLELDAAATMSDLDEDVYFMGAVNLDQFDGDLSNLFDHITDSSEHYETLSEEDFNNIFGAYSAMGGSFTNDDEIYNNLMLSNEDLKVRRIVNRFRHIEEAL